MSVTSEPRLDTTAEGVAPPGPALAGASAQLRARQLVVARRRATALLIAVAAVFVVVTIAGHVVGLFLVFLIVYLAYAKAEWLLEKLGRTGTMIAMRLSAFILLCIGVQIAWNGVRGLLKTLA